MHRSTCHVLIGQKRGVWVTHRRLCRLPPLPRAASPGLPRPSSGFKLTSKWRNEWKGMVDELVWEGKWLIQVTSILIFVMSVPLCLQNCRLAGRWSGEGGDGGGCWCTWWPWAGGAPQVVCGGGSTGVSSRPGMRSPLPAPGAAPRALTAGAPAGIGLAGGSPPGAAARGGGKLRGREMGAIDVG